MKRLSPLLSSAVRRSPGPNLWNNSNSLQEFLALISVHNDASGQLSPTISVTVKCSATTSATIASLDIYHDETKRHLKENKRIRRLCNLKHEGVNEECKVHPLPLRLVISFSSRSRRIQSLCRGYLNDVNVIACHTTSSNFPEILRRSVKKRSFTALSRGLQKRTPIHALVLLAIEKVIKWI